MSAPIVELVFVLMAMLVAIDLVASRLRVPRSIVLVVGGLALALVPGLPHFTLSPALVLFVVLPPLIYQASVQMSWREFQNDLPTISQLAIGCVAFTCVVVAAAVHWLLGFDWSVGFLLGAIVSPPDIVAPLAIARRLEVPKRLIVVLEGEGLANDATALIMYRFAIVAVSTGAFALGRALGTFVVIVAGELAFGLAVGWITLRLRRWARDPQIEIAMSLLTPYACYWLPAYLGGSGVLSTLACGLYISWVGPDLIAPATRLPGVFFWSFLVHQIEGLVFLVMGLQLRTIGERVERTDPAALGRIAIAVCLVTLLVIAARFAWVFTSYEVRRRTPGLRHTAPPSWQGTFFLAFTGVRGIVSLTAALAIPFVVADGRPFPERDLILVVVFGTIVLTLVGQGVALPALVRRLGLPRRSIDERLRNQRAELAARVDALDRSARQVEELAAESDAAAAELAPLHEEIDARRRLVRDPLGDVRAELIAQKRARLAEHRIAGTLDDDVRRRIEHELDLEEAELESQRQSARG